MKTLSGIADVDRVILSELDDKELLKVCTIDRYTWNKVCDDAFLRRRLLAKYPQIEKYRGEGESWKQFFLRAVRYIALLKEKYGYDYTFGDFENQYKIILTFLNAKGKINSEQNKYNKLMLQSVYKGELALVIWCLKNGADIHYGGEGALIASIRYNDHRYIHFEILKYLVEHGANVNGSNYGENPLLLAIEQYNIDIVKYLVEHGADIHYQRNKAFVLASRLGQMNIMEYLVEKGANIHDLDDEALVEASMAGQLEVVKYLLKRNANIHTQKDKALRLAKGEVYDYFYNK